MMPLYRLTMQALVDAESESAVSQAFIDGDWGHVWLESVDVVIDEDEKQ